MLDDQVLSRITGTIIRGVERVATAQCLDLLGVGPDPVTRQKVAKRLPSRMKMLGWHGPRALRISGSSPVQGYWRVPYALPASGAAPTDYVGGPVEVLSDELPAELERVTRLGLGTIAKILKAPFDPSHGNLTRSQVTAAGIAINAQLRADEQRLRTKQTGDVFARLLKIIEEEKKIIEEEKNSRRRHTRLGRVGIVVPCAELAAQYSHSTPTPTAVRPSLPASP
jgi:hypothetical protein